MVKWSNGPVGRTRDTTLIVIIVIEKNDKGVEICWFEFTMFLTLCVNLLMFK